MKKTRSITVMAALTLLIATAMYCVAGHQEMTEKQLAAEMEKALQEDREAQTLAAALFSTSHRRAVAEVKP